MPEAASLHPIDYCVIALFLTGLPAIGWYYSRRTVTADDYLLGGRNMRPLGVGLSLFASLLSTLTYLSIPGEIIGNGPMVLAMAAAYPFVYLIVGRWMIPYIMRLPITSAYELLERRLGMGARMLGAALFLLMRLAWMAMILYATTAAVIVPLFGWPVSAVPWVCALLGMITIAYTTMGGLRAVVVTDVVQTLVLFAGALATVALVSMRVGGMEQIFPGRWPAEWPPPQIGFGFDTATRVTFGLAVLAHFTWWVSTAGSDQMAIQRYLATRDVRTARSVLAISLIANAVVMGVLGLVGVALFSYFHRFPESLAPGQTVAGNADQLFARFLRLEMPIGLTGLVAAGLLAAAMSSLSSGLNSACSVIQVDFLERRGRSHSSSDRARVWRARVISVVLGAFIIVLSAGVGFVSGNLLEVTFKVVNLLTAPLFGLFFTAMFVRWANGPGAIAGAVVGVTTVALINFWPDLFDTPGISFLWGMPLGLLAQIVASYLFCALVQRVRR